MSNEVTIRGNTFPNATVAADYNGVTRTTVSKAKSRGTLDTVGLGRSKKVFYKGKWYYSQTEAAIDHGVTRQAISIYVKRKQSKL